MGPTVLNPRPRAAGEEGAAAAELLGMLPLLLMLTLLVWQGLLAGAAAGAASRAARDVSRAIGQGRVVAASDAEAVALHGVDTWMRAHTTVHVGPGSDCGAGSTVAGGTTRVVVCVQIPVLLPRLASPWQVRGVAELPRAGLARGGAAEDRRWD